MNKQSNTYTIIYIIVMVVIVGAALAATSLALRDRQISNADADKMRQILASVNKTPEASQVQADFERYITAQLVVDASGRVVGDDAFSISMEKAVKEPADKRQLPVFVCTLAPDSVKYIIPVYGAGLWGPIWGYIALDSDGSTVYGAYFDHQGETPGLGAEITSAAFRGEFDGKQLFKDGAFLPIKVVKKGQTPADDSDYVDGVTGGTITSQGVGAMIDNCMLPYEKYLTEIRNKASKN